jgi:radial spoke head protein 4A
LLPDVTESQLIVARQVKKYFTGDLTASVSGYPPFAGNEANFLRAQIALISSDTLVAPSGFFEMTENDDGIKEVFSKLGRSEEDEPPDFPVFDALGTLEMWSHFEIPISRMGRMQPPPLSEDGESLDPYYGEPEALRETMQPLDSDMSGGVSNWRVQQYPSAGGPGSVSVVRSLKWPGAVAVYQCGTPRFVNCYVGYGIVNSNVSYTPPSLPDIQSEFSSNFAEQPDVTEQPILPSADIEAE